MNKEKSLLSCIIAITLIFIIYSTVKSNSFNLAEYCSVKNYGAYVYSAADMNSSFVYVSGRTKLEVIGSNETWRLVIFPGIYNWILVKDCIIDISYDLPYEVYLPLIINH